MKCILKLISNEAKHVNFKNNNNLLHSDSIKNSLKELHERCIVTPSDKVNGNIAVICKIFFALKLMKELRLRGNHASTHKTHEYMQIQLMLS